MINSHDIPSFIPLGNLANLREELAQIHDNSLSDAEMLISMIRAVNKMGLIVGEMADNWAVVESWIKTNGVDTAVESILARWTVDGTLEKLLNQTVLKKLNDNIDNLRQELKNSISNMETTNTSMWNRVINMINNNLKNGGITGTFTTLDELKNKYPNGAQGIFFVVANKHLYYWDNQAWTDAGSYLAPEADDKSISRKKLKDNAIFAPLAGGVNFDFIGKKIIFDDGNIFTNSEGGATSYDAHSINMVSGLSWIVFDTESLTFKENNVPTATQQIVGWCNANNSTAWIHNGNFKVNGYHFVSDTSLATISPNVMYTNSEFTMNLETKEINIPSSITIIFGNQEHTLKSKSNGGTLSSSITATNNLGFIVLDLNTLDVRLGSGSNSSIVLGIFDFSKPEILMNNGEGSMVNDHFKYSTPYNYGVYSTPFIFAPDGFQLNTTTGVLTLPNEIKISMGNYEYDIKSNTNEGGTYDPTLTFKGTGWLVLDPIKGTFSLGAPSNNNVTIGYYDNTIKKLEILDNAVKYVNDENYVSFLGDSITQGVQSTHNYVEYLQGTLRYQGISINCLNNGVGGSIIAKVQGKTDSFVERLSTIDKKSKIIYIFGGTNDYGAGVEIGNADSTNEEEFNGALNSIITKLRTDYPTAQIRFILPIKRHYKTVDGETPNAKGYKLSDYRKAIINACDKYGIEYYNMDKKIDFNPENEDNFNRFTVDGLHPNEHGHRRIAGILYPELKGLLMLEDAPLYLRYNNR